MTTQKYIQSINTDKRGYLHHLNCGGDPFGPAAVGDRGAERADPGTFEDPSIGRLDRHIVILCR